MNTVSEESPRVTGRTRDLVIWLDRRILWLARHWLLAANLFFGLYIGLPFLAPALMQARLTLPARAIYFVYGGVCHQLGYRSWYLFGEAPYYPRAVFQQYTGINPDDLWIARGFLGNEQMGYKVAFCQRDVGIYGALLLGGLVYALPFVRRRLKPLHWVAWVIIGLGPIGLDGFSQLFSNYPYNALPLFEWLPSRESTPLLRSLTGAIFGLANAWLAFPHVDASMREVKEELEAKLARVEAK